MEKVIKTIKAGEVGTKKWLKWVEKHVDPFHAKLISVQHVEDVQNNLRKIRLVIEVEVNPLERIKMMAGYRLNKKFKIRIKYDEYALQQKVKQAGGKYNPNKRVWILDYKTILMLGIEDRIVK